MDELQRDLIKTVVKKYTRRLKRALGIAKRLRKEYEELQQEARLLQEVEHEAHRKLMDAEVKLLRIARDAKMELALLGWEELHGRSTGTPQKT